MKPIPFNLESTNKKPFWEVKASMEEKTGDVFIYGYIVSYKSDDDDPDVTAASFKQALDDLGEIDTLNIYINSGGGSVFQAQAIYSILKRYKAKKNVYIDGLAASAASFVAMAGDRVYMPKNATFMIHNPWTITIGNANELRKEAEVLDKIQVGMIEAYMSHIGDKIAEEKLVELLDAETWMTAQEAYDYGFVDEIIEAKEVAACIDPEIMAVYKNVPKYLLEKRVEGPKGLSVAERQAIIEETQNLVNKIKKEMEEL